MPNPGPTVRADFAQRLRRLRAARGYRRARHLAEALGIDENRYTRYERAETEPDISLLTAICRKLALSPNELLGFEVGGQLSLPPGTALAGALPPGMQDAGDEAPESELAAPAFANPLVGPANVGLWQLAELAERHLAAFHTPGHTPGTPGGETELARIGRVAGLYGHLKADPLVGIGRIASEAARAELSAACRSEIESAIGQLLVSLTDRRT